MRRVQTGLAAMAFAGLLLATAACSLIGGDNDPPWDTDVPESEDFDGERPGWGPEGRRIVFEHNGLFTDSAAGIYDQLVLNQLWVADLQAGTRRRVSRGPAIAPAWSPDGRWIAFATPVTEAYLYKITVDGEQLTPLTGPNSPNPDLKYTVTPEWSPSGDRLLFTIAAGDSSGIWLMKPDGKGVRRIVEWSVMGNWFPDGERVVYVSWDQRVEDESRRKQIFRARDDGTGIEKLTDLPNSGAIGYPSVSPDGTQIAFVYWGDDGSTEVFLMGADGTGIRQVTQGVGIVRRPEWHPDGTKILFGRKGLQTVNPPQRLYLLDVETLEVEPVFPKE